ncbi:alpha/beta fold hydrolase [Nocardioides convexus]|uniref:alpha/beta fold hydrolase n=1 Tax=Nocardioides convexus TaxID=2712224 RepID=UPI0031015EA7
MRHAVADAFRRGRVGGVSEHNVITEDGLRIHVTVRGREDAPLTVLLSHCWTAEESDWHYQVTDLLARYGRDVRIITWDHRGHGRSDRAREAQCTIPHLARDLGLVVDTYAPEGPLVVAGHSVGGMTLTAIPEERPDLMPRIVGALFVSTTSGEPPQGHPRSARGRRRADARPAALHPRPPLADAQPHPPREVPDHRAPDRAPLPLRHPGPSARRRARGRPGWCTPGRRRCPASSAT